MREAILDVRFRRLNSTRIERANISNSRRPIGIQMKRKELTKTFMRISNWKNPLVSMVYTKIFQRSKGWGVCNQLVTFLHDVVRYVQANLLFTSLVKADHGYTISGYWIASKISIRAVILLLAELDTCRVWSVARINCKRLNWRVYIFPYRTPMNCFRLYK